jgi:hypothetical protein
MSKFSHGLENVLREHINETIKGLVLKSKTENYWHPHKREDIEITSYWNETKCEWGTKEDVIRSKITKNLKPIIDKTIEENKDFINFFL